MHDNKVSEKAIWEGTITPDEPPITASQMPHQPQMMFCYKCNQVIPSNSTYCPYCQVKLFTECPKCGAKYSSQYPSCSQCGTNRQEYLQLQKKEQERIERLEREKRIRQEKLERERQEAEAERERQERLRRYEQQEKERKLKEAYCKKNDLIIKTKEYETTYSILSEALKALDDEKNKKNIKTLSLLFIPLIYFALDCFFIDLLNSNSELFFTIWIILFVISTIASIVSNVHDNDRKWQEEYLMQYALSDSRYQESLITTDLISLVWYQRNLSECCIIAYREKYGLTINYKWHSLR